MSKGYYRGRPIEELTRDELIEAFVELNKVCLGLMEKHRKDMDYIKEVL